MYNLFIFFYWLGIRIVSLFGHKKARLMVHGHKETWRKLREGIADGDRVAWFHAASLGEFEQGRPLMERLRREHPEYKILLTFFSPSGYEVRKNYEVADVICYLPLDTPFNARRFVKHARPELAFFIKYEFWRNYIERLHKCEVPLYSVSSIFRPSQFFFKWYGSGSAKSLRLIRHFFVQNEESVELLQRLDISEVSVVGDTRFDRVIDIKDAARPLPLVERFAGIAPEGEEQVYAPHFTLVVGSSWGPDEDIIIPYFNKHPELRLVLAPHVVSAQHLDEIQNKLQRPFARYSQVLSGEIKPENAHCLIIDCYGLLSSIYRYATVAYVGGGFGVGIHNVPEAAVYGVPVIIGPNNKRFREAQDLLANGGCKEIRKAKNFSHLMDDFLAHPDLIDDSGAACREYIADHAGAADQIFNAVFGE